MAASSAVFSSKVIRDATCIEARCDQCILTFIHRSGLDAVTACCSIPLSLAGRVELDLLGAYLRRYRRAALCSCARGTRAGDACRNCIDVIGLTGAVERVVSGAVCVEISACPWRRRCANWTFYLISRDILDFFFYEMTLIVSFVGESTMRIYIYTTGDIYS